MSYFVIEENNADRLIDFFDGLKIKWKIRPLDNGYSMLAAKMGFIDKVLYRLIFKETKTENWSMLKTV